MNKYEPGGLKVTFILIGVKVHIIDATGSRAHSGMQDHVSSKEKIDQ